MKVLVGFCIFAVALAARPEEKKTCTEKPESGFCLALFRMWYYDPESQTCKKFIYGGCRGNGNRYSSEKECLDNCKGVEPEPKQLSEHQEVDCSAPAEVGLCQALIPRYYYNPVEGRCTKFIYGGCGGNSNNFRSEEECNKKCGVVPEPKQLSEDQEIDCSAPPEVGPCDALIHRYYYNPLEDRCTKFIYGGCGGNSNNFETEEECNNKCADSEDAFRAIPMPFSCDCEGGNSTCSCCGHMKISTIRLDKKVCVEVGYDSDNKALLLEIKTGDKVIYKNSISANNPPPVCIGIPPMTTFADVCFDFYDIKVSMEEINYCLNVKPRLLRKNVTDWKVGCYNINRKTTEQPQ